jgi:hypothetical protein
LILKDHDQLRATAFGLLRLVAVTPDLALYRKLNGRGFTKITIVVKYKNFALEKVKADNEAVNWK